MFWLPLWLGVKTIEQLDVPVPLEASVQLPPEPNEPLPSDVKLTAPVGGLGVPESVSVAVTVQVVGLPAVADAGVQTSAVDEARLSTVSVADVPLEPVNDCPSPGYADVIVSVPSTLGVNATAQLEAFGPDCASVHVLAGVNAPVPSADENVSVPVGGEAAPAAVVSVTVALQLEAEASGSVDG